MRLLISGSWVRAPRWAKFFSLSNSFFTLLKSAFKFTIEANISFHPRVFNPAKQATLLWCLKRKKWVVSFFFVWSTEKFGGNPTERPTGAGRKRNKELLGRYDQIRYRGRGWAIGAVDTIQVSIGPPHKHTHTHTHTPAFCLFVCVFVCLISSFCSRLLGSGPNRWWSLNGTVAGRDESNWSTVSDASNQSLTGNGFSPVFFIFFLFFGRFCFHFHSIFFSQ